jgi:hypothetical protein
MGKARRCDSQASRAHQAEEGHPPTEAVHSETDLSGIAPRGDPMNMKFVRGRRERMVSVGWESHVMVIQFKNGRYQYGGVPQEVADKLTRTIYPDHLFNQIVRGKYVSERLDAPSRPKPQPEPTFDF